MKLHAPRAIDPFTPSNSPQGWTHPLKLHRRDPTAQVIRPADIEESKDMKPAVDLSVIAPYGGAQKAKKDLFKPKTKQVFHADPTELALRNEERTPWVLEDFDGKNTWVGTLEQGGASGYALFLFDNDGFKFVPVDRTYRFTKKGNNQVLSAEEAEEQMKRRNALPRWILKDKPGLAGGAGTSGGSGAGGGSGQLFTVRESRERATDAIEEDLDYDAAELFEDDEENPILEGDEEANKAIEERMRREQMGARNFESKEEELEEDIDLDDLFGNKKVTKEGKRTKRYLKKLEGKGDYDSDEDQENPYATEEETDSEAEELEKQEKEKEKEKEKAKLASASGTKPSSPSSTTDVKPGSTPTPGVSPTQKKKKEKERDRGGTATPKLQHRKKESSASGMLTPSKGPSRRPSPRPDTSRASSPKPAGPPSRAGSPHISTPASVGPATPVAIPEPPPSQTSTIPSAPSTAPAPAPSSKSLIVRFQISPAGRKRLREEDSLAPVKRIKFNLKSGGKSLSPSPPPEDRRASITEPSRTASPDDHLITEDEIVNLIRSERLTTKQLLAKLKGKLKRNEGNKAIVGGVLKRRCRIVEGFLVLKD